MGHTMVIAVPPADLDRLDDLVAEQQADELRWQAGVERAAGTLTLRGAALRGARERIRIERDRLRETGHHRVTRRRALAPALRAELEGRGWIRPWAAIPDGARQAGQTLGGTGPFGGAGLTARLCVTLPNSLWAPLHHGVYWSNLPHIQALEAWSDRWGTRPTSKRTAPREALDEREVIVALIITTGQILRTALENTIKSPPGVP
ncbi:hypothetical protein ACFWAR_14370 [Streptomyces sp. NPDC059917]|uniref:hypothetical protein n=1 Tax=Streptomyces sp. NPDC059917 TaxID=3347002 RepID=UPI0036501697